MFKSNFLILLLCFSLNSFSQDKEKTEAKEEAPKEEVRELTEQEKLETEFQQIKVERLKRIRTELTKLKSKIYATKKRLNEPDLDMVSKIQADSQLSAYQKEYNTKKYLFIETATDIHLNEEEKRAQKADFFADIQQILSPAMDSFKQISERPRQIQELKEKAESVERRFKNAKSAQKKLEEFYKSNKDKTLNRVIKDSIKSSKKLVKELAIESEDLKFKILKIEKDQEPFIQTFSKLILDFFKTKGLNLFLAFITFIGVFWGFRVSQARIISVILFKINRSEKKDMYQWVVRPIRVIYSVFSIIFAFFLGILTLYALNDWVLVTFILFTIAALIWSSKHYLPLFLEQSKIVLNLGAIREGERVIFNGIPWQIKSLGYYCRLYNPVLSGGFLRVNTRELLTTNSRRIIDKEPWFPTKTGDWVEIDGQFGQVILQSPEQVILKTLGEEKILYKSAEFYNMAPKNLSNGFAIEFIFGVDYMHQGIIFKEVIPNFEENIKKAIEDKHEDIKESFQDLTVEFISAGASSLDLRFFLKCDGNIAAKKMFLMRSIQGEFVKVCNEFNYVIPFNQLTVHMESNG